MKRTTPRSRNATHECIVEAGARAIRRSGYDGARISDIMKQAGFTHGGFYAHFPSREAMLIEASDRAGAQVIATFSRIAAAVPSEKSLQALLRAYLAEEPVKKPEIGCPIAARGTEMQRQAPAVRRVVTRRIKEMIDLDSRQSADRGQRDAHERALVTTATMIGTVVLTRAIDEEAVSESLLRPVREHLIAQQPLNAKEKRA